MARLCIPVHNIWYFMFKVDMYISLQDTAYHCASFSSQVYTCSATKSMHCGARSTYSIYVRTTELSIMQFSHEHVQYCGHYHSHL